jgi:hypothetical protein
VVSNPAAVAAVGFTPFKVLTIEDMLEPVPIAAAEVESRGANG